MPAVVNRSKALDDPCSIALLSLIDGYEFQLTKWFVQVCGNGCKAPAWSALSLCAHRMTGSFAEPSSLWPLIPPQKPDMRLSAIARFTLNRRMCQYAMPAGERTLQIATESGRWYENGRENQTVKGAIDIDLGWSPSTNTLPIKRLKLEIRTNQRRVYRGLGALS